jgi:hypothetical protein
MKECTYSLLASKRRQKKTRQNSQVQGKEKRKKNIFLTRDM